MFKKLFLIVSVLAVSAFLYFGYSHLKQIKAPSTDIYSVIPENAVALIEIEKADQQWNSISSNSIIWEELKIFPEILEIQSNIETLDSAFQHTAPHTYETINKQLLISFYPSESGLSFALHFQLPHTIKSKEQLEELVQAIGPTTKINNEEQLYEWNYGDQVVFGCINGNVISVSLNPEVTENIITAKKNGNITTDKAFGLVKKTSSKNAEIKLYVHPSLFTNGISELLNKNSDSFIPMLFNGTHWSELDVVQRPDEITVNGFTTNSDTSGKWLSIFKGQEVVSPNVIEFLPNRTSFIAHFGFSDFTKLRNDFGAITDVKMDQKVFEWDTTYDVSIHDRFLAYVDDEIAYCIAEPDLAPYEDDMMIWVRATDANMVYGHLSEICLKVDNELQEDLYSLTFQGHPISKLNIPEFLPMTLGLYLNPVTKNYFTQIGDYIVFANSPAILQWTISKYEQGKTLQNDAHFMAFRDKMAQSSNVLIYSNIAGSAAIYKSLANKQIQGEFDQYSEWIQKFQATSIQLSHESDDLYYLNGLLKYNPIYKKENQSLWELALDTIATFKPLVVKNHYTQASEIFIQDINNTIYLIDNKGNILWKRQLLESIISRPEQIDMYGNGKLQLAFNTANHIYIIDRNGKNVDNFPINLPASSSAEMAIFDYSNTHEYRFLVPLKNGEIRNYNTEGNQVNGWNYSNTGRIAVQKIQFASIKNRDYLLVVYENGLVSGLSRRGDVRISFKSSFGETPEDRVRLHIGSSMSNSYLIAVTPNKQVKKISLSDQVSTLFTIPFDSDIRTKIQDVTRDGSLEIIVADSYSTAIFKTDGSPIYSDSTATYSPISIYHFNQDHWIGYASGEFIYLHNLFGKSAPTFPLRGSHSFSIADINKDGRWNILVTDSKGTLYTYSLDN